MAFSPLFLTPIPNTLFLLAHFFHSAVPSVRHYCICVAFQKAFWIISLGLCFICNSRHEMVGNTNRMKGIDNWITFIYSRENAFMFMFCGLHCVWCMISELYRCFTKLMNNLDCKNCQSRYKHKWQTFFWRFLRTFFPFFRFYGIVNREKFRL